MKKNLQGDFITGRSNNKSTTGITPSGGRNYGIDLLRIVAMLMIITLHMNGQGGILAGVKPFTLKYEMVWSLQLLCNIGVNLYALISGYAGLYSKYKPHKLITLWLQVVLLTLLSVGIGSALGLSPKKLGFTSSVSFLRCLFPVTFNLYWYFTAYAALFIFIPLLNKALLTLEKKTLSRILLLIILLFSILAPLYRQSALALKGGYSAIFIIILYIIGGYLRKYDIPERFSKAQLSAVFAVSFIISVICKNLEAYAGVRLGTNYNFLTAYNVIFFIIEAAALLMIFAKLNIKNKKLIGAIRLLAPLTFGVYIIHLSPAAWYYIKGLTKFLLAENTAVMLLGILLLVLCIYIACSFIDYLRALLFKAIKIDRLSLRIYALAAKLWRFLCRRLYALYRLTAPKPQNCTKNDKDEKK